MSSCERILKITYVVIIIKCLVSELVLFDLYTIPRNLDNLFDVFEIEFFHPFGDLTLPTKAPE